MKNLIRIASITGLFSISMFAYSGEITDTYTSGDTLTATTMNNIKSSVNDNHANIGTNTINIDINSTALTGNTTNITTNTGDIATNATNIDINSTAITDHDNRITALENASPAIGRLAFSVSDGNPNKTLNDAITSSAVSTVFPSPSDYVAGTVTIKALVSGCSGQNVRVSIVRNGVNVGSNSSLIIINPIAQTIAIPSGSTFTFFVVEVTTTTTILSDLNTVTLNRFGADALDTCTSGLFVRGFIVEYPRG